MEYAFRKLTGRAPGPKELKLLEGLLAEQTEMFQKEPERAEKLVGVGEHKRAGELPPIELAGMTAVVQTIMNLDATVWKR